MAKEKKEEKKHEMAGKMAKTIHEHHHYMEQTPARGSNSIETGQMEGGKCPTCGRSYDPQNEAVRSSGPQGSQGDTSMNAGTHDRKPKEKEGGEKVR